MGGPGRSWGCPDSNDGRVHVNGQGIPPIDLESWPGATELFVPLSTLDAVRVILALEMQFDVAVPDSMLTRKHIRTIRSLRQLLETISG